MSALLFWLAALLMTLYGLLTTLDGPGTPAHISRARWRLLSLLLTLVLLVLLFKAHGWWLELRWLVSRCQ